MTTEEEITLETKHENDFNENTDAKVPKVIGMEMLDAVKALQDANLNYKISSAIEYSDEYPLGTIMVQSYPEGTIVAKGSTIVILVSAGTDKFVVKKSYLNNRITEIKGDLAKFSDIITSEFNTFYCSAAEASKYIINYVYKIEVDGVDLASSPEDIVATKGSHVTVTYCLGLQLKTVPNVVGKNAEQAQKTLAAAGFGIDIQYADGNGVQQGLVFSQNPAAGGSLGDGKAVTVYVSQPGASVPTEAEPQG